MAYKCWIYVLKVVSSNSYYVGFTSNLEQRLDAHRKGRGHEATKVGPLELVEVVECDNDSVYKLEKTKTLEYMEKYGEERVVGYRFSFKKRKTKKKRERPPPPATYSLIYYGEEEDDFRVCRECMHYDYSDHFCILLDEPTIGPNTCVFWSSGFWGEDPETIVEIASQQAETWFTPERAESVREYCGRASPMYKIFEGVFPELSVKRPYTAYITQKELVYEFIFDSVGIPKGGDRWEAYDKLHQAVRERVSHKRHFE